MSNVKQESPSTGGGTMSPQQQQQQQQAFAAPQGSLATPNIMMNQQILQTNMVQGPSVLAVRMQQMQNPPATGGTKQNKAALGARFKKAPDAPKRFKSAFIIFSAEKHREIKEKYALEGRTEKTTDIAKVVSQAWREMDPEEREIWEDRAKTDKTRYEMERSLYKGPWKVPANKRTPKDPSAPKRPMSAFLAFSNKRRAALKRENPDATNADLSKMLSIQWKTADPDLKKEYTEEEAGLRGKYKIEMAKWRERVAEEKKTERKEREAIAMQAAEAHQNAAAAGQQQGQLPHEMSAPGTLGGFPNPAAMYPYGMGASPGGDFGGGNMGHGGHPFPNPGLMANPFAAQQFLGGAAALQQFLAQQQLFQQQGQMGQRGVGMFGQGMPGNPGQHSHTPGGQLTAMSPAGFQGFPGPPGGEMSQQQQPMEKQAQPDVGKPPKESESLDEKVVHA